MYHAETRKGARFAVIDVMRLWFFLSVFFFHIWPHVFPYGYLGVDGFFIISGFLVARMLEDSSEDSRRRFLRNRISRIFIPKLGVISLYLPFAIYFLPPDSLENFAQSVVASVAALENVFFFLKTNYWATANVEKPLLHYWSLGVEMQFYFLAFVVASMFSRIALPFLVMSIIGASISVLINNDSASFYLIFSRIPLFLFGILLAHFSAPKIKIFVLIISFVFISATNLTYSALTSLLFCSVYFFRDSRLCEVCAVIGKRTYSYYLVHWILISSHWFLSYRALTVFDGILLGVLTLVFGEISYRVFEQRIYQAVVRA